MRANPERRGVTMTSFRWGFPATIGAAAGSTRYDTCAFGNRRLTARITGVVRATSPSRRSRTSRILNSCRQASIVASSMSITGMSSLMGYTRLH